MSTPAPPLAVFLQKHWGGKDTISLTDLMNYCSGKLDYHTVIDGGIASRVRFWNRLEAMQHDADRITFSVRLADPPVAAVSGQHQASASDDPQDVSAYMDVVLQPLLQACPAPQHVQDLARTAYQHHQAELAGGVSLHHLAYKIDQDGRTISVEGLVRTHVQRDKGRAPTPQGGTKYKKPGDHKGHLYAATFAADPTVADAFLNVVWEMGDLNLSHKKRFENAVKEYTTKHPGCIVTTIHEPLFGKLDGRPFAMNHYVVVNGVVVGCVKLDNI
jgi:hypothetical protein